MNHKFAFYATARMDTLFGSAGSASAVIFDGSADYTDLTLYFGCPSSRVKLETAENAGIDAVTLTPVSRLPVRENLTEYQEGDLTEPAGGNGMFYVCRRAGTSAAAPPNWLAQDGANVQDGGVVWQCLGPRLRPEDVKLADSAEGLAAARGGAPLSLGATLRGGKAVAVHIRFARPAGSLHEYAATAQVGIEINPCEIKGI